MRSLLLASLLALPLLTSCGDTSVSAPINEAKTEGQGGSSGAAASAGGTGGTSAGSAGVGAGGQAGSGGSISIPDGGVGGDNCGDVGKVIFVVSSENVLLKFDPPKLSFTAIGKLDCTADPFNTPFSMAVDRTGTAFVLYQDGNIFRVSTETAACEPSGYQAGQLGWQRFGMGYVSDMAGGTTETLFVIDGSALGGGGSGKGLGKISAQGKLSTVGQFDGGLSGRTAEVTGLGDGRLFAFFVGSQGSSVAELDKGTGSVLSNESQPLPDITSWAFAHWGGSFYLFNANGGLSRVDKYTPGKGTTKVVANAGYTIVGAGVSTCAPTVEDIN